MDFKRKQVKINPLNFLTIEWITPLMFSGARKPLQQEDLYDLPDSNQATYLAGLLDPYWCDFKKLKGDPNAKIQNTISSIFVKQYYIRFFFGLLLQGLSVACVLTIPTFMKQILLYLTPLYPRSLLYFDSGVALSFILAALQLGRTVFEKTSIQLFNSLQVDVKTILIGAIYEKSLRLSQASSRKYTQGQILNLINVDVEKISMSFIQMASLFVSPINVVVSVILLGQNIFYAVWGGAGSLFAILLFQMAVIGLLVKFQKAFLSIGDRRLKAIREMLYGIKIIKYRSLEKFFIDRISKIRDEQVGILKKYYILQVYFVGMIQIAPISMPIGAFLVYSAVYGDLSPVAIFPSLTLFNNLFQPILVIPQALTALVVASVSYKRVVEFLAAEEADELETLHTSSLDPNGDVLLEIKDGSFKWEKTLKEDEEKQKEADGGKKNKKKKKQEKEIDVELEPVSDAFKIENVTITVKKGSKVGIVGPVGSGKSSLLSAIIGEMPKVSGELNLGGKLAYCSQQPWILTDTVEGNIVFNNEFNQDRFDKVLEATGLDKDMKQFPAGVKTEIGEKGVNLSGGQKARVAMARAMYQNSDIVILDDPISALDAQVGRKVFTDAIKGFLKDKTVILVTHQLHFLPELDHIITLDKGKVAEQGTFKKLMEMKGNMFEMMKNYSVDEEGGDKTAAEEKVKKDDEKNDNKGGIIVEEDQEKGSVSSQVYWHYFEKCGGIPYLCAIFITSILSSTVQVFNNIWLSWWSSDPPKYDFDRSTYMTVYGLLGLGQFICALLLTTSFLTGGFRASKHYHKKALGSLMTAPMGYFDSQPIGRILNRMSKDIESVDQQIWIILFLCTISSTGLLASAVYLIYIKYELVFLVAPLAVLFFLIIMYYQRSNREFKRFESTNRSPLYAHVSETLAGLAIVKAYGVEKQFIMRQRKLMNISNIPTYLRLFASTWVSLRLEALTCTITLFLCLLGSSNAIDPPSIGLALTYTLGFTGLLSLLLISSSQLENEFNSVERLSYYCDKLPKEAAFKTDHDPDAANWPTVGAISVNNITMAYPSRPDLPVLKNISFEVKPGENIGIIGRTGSGKSSLMTALFRIVELSEGTISIDGVDISTIGLEALRKSIQIIPQEPVLFTGTIRDNLDVESLYQDDDIWKVLEMIGLKEYVSSLSDKLDSAVAENGENLSVGQRQLICLGRAILLKPRILIMDEATASVDAEADKLIQLSIKTHFKDTTVLSIAHRLNTIADFDRVLVLENGVKKEYDSPHILLSTPNTLFSQLADATGPTNAAALRQVAKEKYDKEK
ncbi:Multidrug resistance-associated protein 1 [Boothiomyces sp. JEL0838]|nr:Multidrug resistance-associated protein 1 [Boothiomyces sp. JEL0838]